MNHTYEKIKQKSKKDKWLEEKREKEIRQKERFKNKNQNKKRVLLRLKHFINYSLFSDLNDDSIDNFEEHALPLLDRHIETREEYLEKYHHVVEMLKQGLSLRKIALSTECSFPTVHKVSIIRKYGDPSLQPNPYLNKHADVVTEVMKGHSQRVIADNTGVSLNTVSIIVKLTEFDYIHRNRTIGIEVARKRKLRKEQERSIKSFIIETYQNWNKSNYKLFIQSIEQGLTEFENYFNTRQEVRNFNPKLLKKTYKEAIIQITTTKKDELLEIEKRKKKKILLEKQNSINEEKFRLEQIEYRKNREKAKRNQELADRKRELEYRKERKLKNERLLKGLKSFLDEYLNVGINPWSKEWDKCPEQYYNLTFKGIYISEFWEEDLNILLKIRQKLPDLEQYATANLKEYNKESVENLLSHRRHLNQLDS